MLLWDFGHKTACSQKDFGGGGIYTQEDTFWRSGSVGGSTLFGALGSSLRVNVYVGNYKLAWVFPLQLIKLCKNILVLCRFGRINRQIHNLFILVCYEINIMIHR